MHMCRRCCAGGELDDRLHEFKALAYKGVKQYHFYEKFEEVIEENIGEAGAEVEADRKPEEYTAVAVGMQNECVCELPLEKRNSAWPEDLAWKKAKTERESALRKLKVTCDQCTADLAKDEEVLEQLGEKKDTLMG